MQDWQAKATIKKTDDERRIVYGWASMSMVDGRLVVDSDGDTIEPDELEKAATAYVLASRIAGEQHERLGIGRVCESFVSTVEKQLEMGGDGNGPVGWWIGIKVDDETVWDRFKAGELTEFSIGGRARRRAD